MKKITITTTEFGPNATSGENIATATYYVSDDYSEEYSEWDEVMHHEGENYTKELRDIHTRIYDLSCVLDEEPSRLEDFAEQIKADNTLNEDDRESLVSALQDAISSLSNLNEECSMSLAIMDDVLEAFKSLSLSE